MKKSGLLNQISYKARKMDWKVNCQPTGFMKVRYYGFLHPSSSVSLEKIRILIEASNGVKVVATQVTISKYIPSCPDCGGQLEYLYSVPALYGLTKGIGVIHGMIEVLNVPFLF